MFIALPDAAVSSTVESGRRTDTADVRYGAEKKRMVQRAALLGDTETTLETFEESRRDAGARNSCEVPFTPCFIVSDKMDR